jgi:hypothetical protein
MATSDEGVEDGAGTVARPRIVVHSNVGMDKVAQLTPADVGDETYTQRGTTAYFVVCYAQSLGANGPTLADAVLATCEADYNKLQEWFGDITIGSLPFNVYIRHGSNGGSHVTCSATELYCDAFNGTDADLERSLVVAERDEVRPSALSCPMAWSGGASERNVASANRSCATARRDLDLHRLAISKQRRPKHGRAWASAWVSHALTEV